MLDTEEESLYSPNKCHALLLPHILHFRAENRNHPLLLGTVATVSNDDVCRRAEQLAVEALVLLDVSLLRRFSLVWNSFELSWDVKVPKQPMEKHRCGIWVERSVKV